MAQAAWHMTYQRVFKRQWQQGKKLAEYHSMWLPLVHFLNESLKILSRTQKSQY